MAETFVIGGGPREGWVAASALFKGQLYDRRIERFAPTLRLMQAIGIAEEKLAPSPEVDVFLLAGRGLKGAVRFKTLHAAATFRDALKARSCS